MVITDANINLATNNVLYDSETKTISGLLDFGFTLVPHPYHEFEKIILNNGMALKFRGIWSRNP